MNTETRANPYELIPETLEQGRRFQEAIEAIGIDRSLIDLIKLRASQINGCAYCLHLHSRHALQHGERDVRIFVLPAWRESTLFTPRERAVLAWTEGLTSIATEGAEAGLYRDLREHFSDKEISGLT